MTSEQVKEIMQWNIFEDVQPFNDFYVKLKSS